MQSSEKGALRKDGNVFQKKIPVYEVDWELIEHLP